ncbi:unnamed protein product [Thlaspi arvense]|uniref:MATH domain-containing protein n=1 Tax=Thlaspi arvense TaxID=13288 RepID=A0AAU9SHS9_THLAR|nr:unnamed protein product [Thlaspi arvense]
MGSCFRYLRDYDYSRHLWSSPGKDYESAICAEQGVLKHSLFLVFCNRLTTSAVSAAALLALKYVSFPIQTLAKCAKMIPVMVWGTLIMQKRYRGFDYLGAFLVTLGCSVFILFPAGDDISPYNKGRENTAWGVSLMVGYLGFTNELHSEIICLILQGHLLPAVDFVSRHKDCFFDIAFLSTDIWSSNVCCDNDYKTASCSPAFGSRTRLAGSNALDPHLTNKSYAVSVPTESGKHKVSQEHENLKVPIPIWMSRKRSPTSYSVRFESFTTMMNLVNDGYYESRPFTAGGYNWTFLIYPKGIAKNNVVSVYARIDTSSIIGDRQDVYAELKFFVYNRSTGNYDYYQSECEFGIDVFVTSPFNNWENFSSDQNFRDSHQESGKHKGMVDNLNSDTLSEKDENLKAPVPVGLWRERPPTSYSVRFESFKAMMDLVKDGYYESQPFTVDGFSWTFLIYPKGIEKNGFVSVYARINNSSLFDDVKKEPVIFHPIKPEWGVENFLPTLFFEVSGPNGFMSVNGECEFGIDIFFAPPFNQWEIFSYDDHISDPIFKWHLTNFYTLDIDSYTSETFSSGGRNWVLKVYPSGNGEYLSLYLLSEPNEKDYVRATLRVLNQISSNNNVEKHVEGWANAAKTGWGFEEFILISDLKDRTKGFVVGDLLEIEVEIMAFSKTKHSI